MWYTISHSPCFAHGIWEHDEPAGKCRLRRLRQSDWFSAVCGSLPPPVTGNVPCYPGGDEEACGGGGGDGGHLSPSPLHPTIIHGSILSLSFFILTLPSSILRQPHASCSAPTSSLWASVIHLPYLTIPANESSYLGSVRAEIRVSFISLYKPLSPLPGTNSKGNRTVNPGHFTIITSNDAFPVWKGEPWSCQSATSLVTSCRDRCVDYIILFFSFTLYAPCRRCHMEVQNDYPIHLWFCRHYVILICDS